MKALCWEGVNELGIRDVPEPTLVNRQDAILRVRASSVCGSDLHLINGYVPMMREGDVLGHEFLGEVVEVGPDVTRRRVGDRAVVASFISCGRCWYCAKGLFSLCDNTNPHAALLEKLWGFATGGVFGYSQGTGGFAGSHAEYVRVPYADYGAFPVPEGLTDEQAVFASDALPTGWMGADLCDLQGGEVVAVWGAGAVGLMAMSAAQLLGAERIIAIDRLPERLALAQQKAGATVLNYERVDVSEALLDLTGGRGPDACIECVGLEAHSSGLQYAYDRAKQALRLQTERGPALRQAIYNCRKGGTVSVMGVFAGAMDKFPIGAVMNKGLTIRSGQQHGQRYIPMLLERTAAGEIDPGYLATHPMPLSDAVHGYEMFKNKQDGCVRAVFHPYG